jgi:transposase
MGDYSEAFVGLDTSKLRNAVAIADAGRGGEVRFFGEIENTPAATAKLVRKLSSKYKRLTFCYEAGPTGYGLHRQIRELGFECVVVAPSLIPKRPGDKVKTNRRDALSLAKLLRADELTAVWVPDGHHEAMRDLTRARETAMLDLRTKRQHVSALLLRLGKPYPESRKSWTKAHLSWIASQRLAAAPGACWWNAPGAISIRRGWDKPSSRRSTRHRRRFARLPGRRSAGCTAAIGR